MGFKIRPFEYSDADYQEVVQVNNAVWTDNLRTVESWRHSDKTRDPKYLFKRLVVEKDGRIVAVAIYCEPAWAYKPGKYYISMDVHPACQRQGIGAAIYDHMLEILEQKEPVSIGAHTREDQHDAISFLTHRGFKQVLREPVSRLNVAAFDTLKFEAVSVRVKAMGIQIIPLSKLCELDADWKQKLYDLEWTLLRDVPSHDEFTQMSFEIYEQRVIGAPDFSPNLQFVALDGELWVGLSALWTSKAEPEKLYTGLTGVLRSHRRQGIATALKANAIGCARRQGILEIETDNEEQNPMFQLNLQLGFEAQPAWVEYEKKFGV